MTHWNEAAVTNVGNDMLNEMMAGRTLTVTAAYGGTGLVDAEAIASQTALVDQKQTLRIIDDKTTNEGRTLTVQITNADEEYELNQVALYAKLDADRDPQAEAKMLCLMQDRQEKGAIIVPSTDDPSFVLELYCIIKITNTGRFEVTIDKTGIVSLAYLKNELSKIEPILGEGEPTQDTAGQLGQHYIDTKSHKEYTCVAMEGDKYTWQSSGATDATDLTYDGKKLSDVLDDMGKDVDGSKTLMGSEDPTSSTKGAVGQQYVNSVTGQTFICTEANDETGTYKWIGSGGAKPQISVTVTTGSEITCTCGDTVLKATSEDGGCVFTVPSYGTWKLKATLNGKETDEEEVSVDQVKQFAVALYYAKIAGVCWNYGLETTELARLTPKTDPYGLATVDVTEDPTPAVGSGGGSSPFDKIAPWSGMEVYNIVDGKVGPKKGEKGFSLSANDVVVYIPGFYYRVIDDAANSKRYYYIADREVDNFELHPGSNKYVGRYETIDSDGYFSRTGAAPVVSMTRDVARTKSKAKGEKWRQFDFAVWCAIVNLYIVEFADWNSQEKIGRGRSDLPSGGSAINTGGTDGMIYHTGCADGIDGLVAVQYRNIENFQANVWKFTDGFNANDRRAYICTDPTKYKDDTSDGYIDTGVTMPTASNSFITKLAYVAVAPWAFIPEEVGGSETTHVAAACWTADGWRILYVGGNWYVGSSDGVVAWSSSNPSSGSRASLGARLLYDP